MPITIKVVSSNPVHGEVYSIQQYVIIVSVIYDRLPISLGTPVSATNKTDLHKITEILLKVALNTINDPTPIKQTTTSKQEGELPVSSIYSSGHSSTNTTGSHGNHDKHQIL